MSGQRDPPERQRQPTLFVTPSGPFFALIAKLAAHIVYPTSSNILLLCVFYLLAALHEFDQSGNLSKLMYANHNICVASAAACLERPLARSLASHPLTTPSKPFKYINVHGTVRIEILV
jgi:hypothetical protein